MKRTTLRIAQVTSSLADPLGGAEQYCVELSRWLAAEGADVHLFGRGASRRLIDSLAATGVTVHELRRPRPYAPGEHGRPLQKALFHGADLVDSLHHPRALTRRLQGFDVVHVHRWSGLGAAVLAVPGPVTVHTVHDYSIVDTTTTTMRNGRPLDRLPRLQQWRAAALDRPARQAQVAVFPTRRTMERHRRFDSHLGQRQVVVPHGWRIPDRASERVERRDGLLTVTFMGKLIADKGVTDLLDAWAAGIPGARLVFAGAGDLEPELRRAADDGRVEFRGWLSKDEQAALLAETDVLALPSRWPENFPLVVAEALLAEVPVLATRTSAPELLHDGENALIVEPSVQALRNGLERLVVDEHARSVLRRGAAAAGAELDMDVHGERVLKEYELAGAGRRPAAGTGYPFEVLRGSRP